MRNTHRSSGAKPPRECTHTTYIYTHELSLAINAVTTADLVVACMCVVGRARKMSKMPMPQRRPKSHQHQHLHHEQSTQRLPCARMMKIHMNVNQTLVRAHMQRRRGYHRALLALNCMHTQHGKTQLLTACTHTLGRRRPPSRHVFSPGLLACPSAHCAQLEDHC